MSNSTLSPSSDQNKPANYSTGWIPEPETRGTWGLLYSCIFTLSLCVYSAIHINVPARGESGNTRFWRKVKWVIIAIFAPEIALYSAWQQYYIANNFRYHFYNIKREQAGLPPLWNEPWWWRIIDFIAFMFHIITKPSVEEANSTNTVPAPKKFSLTYAFYVVMGGLVVNVDDIYDNVSRATLTPTGVLNLAKRTSCGRFFVPDETIRDKSKADNLAKVLVIFQPLNVVDPTVVDPGSLEELALSLMRSAGSAYEPFTTLKPQEQFQSPSLRNGTPRHARKYWKQNSKSASEASFLIFDTARLQFAKENEATLPILPIMEGLAVQKNSPENYGNDLVTERRVPSVSEQGKDAMGPAGAGFHRADTGALESQSQCPANKQLATFHRAHFPKADEAKTLVTGQILSSGIGPASLLTLTHRTQYFFWRSQISRLLRIRRLAPIAREVHVIDARLRTMMPDPVRSPGEELLFHGLAISLSQKDLLRWHRASIAFADEFSTQVEDEKIASYSPNRLSLPQPPGSVYRYYENSAGVDTRREDTVVTAPPDLRLQTLVTVPSVNTSLIYTFPNFVLRSLNLSLEAVSEILDGSLNVNAIVSIAAVSGIYASVHLALWNYDFPTETERLLWRIASCALGLPFALTTVVLMIATALFFPRYLASSIMSRGQVPVGYGSRAEYVRTNFRVQSSETVEQINAQSLPEESAERVDSIAEHFKTRAQALEAQEPPTTDRVSAHNEPILTTRTSTDDMSRPRQAPNDAVRGDQYSDTEHSRTWDLLRQTLRNPSAHPWMVCSLGILIIVLLPLIIVILGWILAALAAIILYVILYVLSRLYIVVEAFVSLRRVPMGV